MDFITDKINEAISFLTNPNGLGFPMLIAGGLGIILYLMHITTKGWKRTDTKTESKKDKYKDTNIPYKPF